MKTIFYFTADWCQPCKRTRPIVEDLNRERIDAKFQFIDVDSEFQLAQKFNVTSVPTFILFENEQEKNRIIGGKTRQELESFIDGK